MEQIDFSKVPGRALFKMVKGKSLANWGLEEQYTKWIMSQKVAKFTGFPHELLVSSNAYEAKKSIKNVTIDKQFMGLVEAGGGADNSNFITVLDTSDSMDSKVVGTTVSSFQIGMALAVFFSYKLKGTFSDSYIEFNRTARLRTFKLKDPTGRFNNPESRTVGNTDFQSVINLFLELKNDGVPEADFPTGILCISDGEFDSTKVKATNFDVAINRLRTNFSKEFCDNFRIILWDIRNDYYGGYGRNSSGKFETYESNTPNVFYFAGYDGSVVSFLTGIESKGGTVATKAPKSQEELILAALTQPVLQLLNLNKVPV